MSSRKPTAPPRTSDVRTLADLTPDPQNARRHSPRGIGAIVNSLHRVGAARSIVIDEDGRVLAGNGTVEAAAEAGIEKVLVVETDGNTIVAVRRTGLTPRQKAELAISDNRTTELSEFDADALEALAGEHGLDLAELDITEAELQGLRDGNERVSFADDVNTRPALQGLDNGASVKVVMAVDDLRVVEKALELTGNRNRGDALAEVCEHYVRSRANEKAGQRDGGPQGEAAVGGTEGV